jgi:hypothetical protein
LHAIKTVNAISSRLMLASTYGPQEIAVTHNLSTQTARVTTKSYGRIVETGVGEADTIGETVGTGCAARAANTEALAMKAPHRTIPTNHRFMNYLLRLLRDCSHRASYPRIRLR